MALLIDKYLKKKDDSFDIRPNEPSGGLLIDRYSTRKREPEVVEEKKSLFQRIKSGIGSLLSRKKEEKKEEPQKRNRVLDFLAGVGSGGVQLPRMGGEDDSRAASNVMSGVAGTLANTVDMVTALFETMENQQKKNVEAMPDPKEREKAMKASFPTKARVSAETRKVSKKIKRWASEMAPEDPDFADKLMQGVGSMGLFALTNVISGGSAIVPVVFESMGEGGAVYEDNRDAGLSVEESSKNASKTLALNLILNSALNVFDIDDDGMKILARTLKGFTFESLQEGSQQIISNIYTKRPLMEGVFESMGVGGILGAGTSVMLPTGKNGESKQYTQKEEEVSIADFKPSKIVKEEAKIIGKQEEEKVFNVETKKKSTPTKTETVVEVSEKKAKLPSGLAFAKPRFGYGAKGLFSIDFESDVDKALFIVAQEKPSAADEKYMDFLRNELSGLEDGEIRNLGRQVKSSIKDRIANDIGVKDNVVTFPADAVKVSIKKEVEVPETKAEEARKYKSAKKRIAELDRKIVSEQKRLNKIAPDRPVFGGGAGIRDLSERDMREYARLNDFISRYENKVLGDPAQRIETKRKLAGAGIKFDADAPLQQLTDIYNRATKKPAPKPSKKPVIQKQPAIKAVTEQQIKTTKDLKGTKEALKNIRKELSEAVVEAEGLALVAQEQRAGLDTKEIAKLKSTIAINKKLREGDIETVRASRAGGRLNRVIENVQEVHPEMSEAEAYEFALNLPTKAQESPRNAVIRELEKKEKKLSKLLDLLKDRQKELKIKSDDELTKEWSRALAVQEKLISVIEVPSSQMPVGEGPQRVSGLEARLKGALKSASQEQIDELGLSTYNQSIQDEQIRLAMEYTQANPDDALRVLSGEIPPPKGILKTSILGSLVTLGSQDTALATKIATQAATRYGQEINMLKTIMADNPVVMMQDIVNVRIKAYEKRTGQKAEKRIKREIDKINKEVKAPDRSQWDAFIKKIRC